jgi:hypothetical protein
MAVWNFGQIRCTPAHVMSSDTGRISAPRLGTGLRLLQMLIGLSALAGGVGWVVDPSGRALGFSREWLLAPPLSDYFVPGLDLQRTARGASLVPRCRSLAFRGQAGLPSHWGQS